MFIDLTLKVTPQMIKDAGANEDKALSGHLGTHFDVMDKEFPLEYLELEGIAFDVSKIKYRDINIDDIDLDLVDKGMFVGFYSGFIETEGYGGEKYFSEHPQLSNELIESLLLKEISIIGIDFAGIRRGKEHTKKDQYCADKGVFIVENLCNLKTILKNKETAHFTANTYPINYEKMSGLPCRVVAKLKS